MEEISVLKYLSGCSPPQIMSKTDFGSKPIFNQCQKLEDKSKTNQCYLTVCQQLCQWSYRVKYPEAEKRPHHLEVNCLINCLRSVENKLEK